MPYLARCLIKVKGWKAKCRQYIYMDRQQCIYVTIPEEFEKERKTALPKTIHN
jgi:hypothetical protein